jgi:molecular chaperone GrpE (heat shock protein)
MADEAEAIPASSEPPLETPAPAGIANPDAETGQPATTSLSDGVPAALQDASMRVESAIEAGVERVLDAFERKLAYDASKQLQVDRLHAELQEHRAGLVNRAARPIVHGMIRLHDGIGKLVASLRSKSAEELSSERFFALLDGLQEDVEIVLEQNGIGAYRQTAGTFDPRRQRALRMVVTHDSQLAGQVAETLRPGFEQGSEILEKERVAVYEFQPAPAPNPSPADSPEPQTQSEPQSEGEEN